MTNESDCPGAPPFAERLECLRPPKNPSAPPAPTEKELENSSNRQLLRMLVLAVHGVRATTESTHEAVLALAESQRSLESRVAALERQRRAFYLSLLALVVAVYSVLRQVVP